MNVPRDGDGLHSGHAAPMMRAALFTEYGPPEVLKVVDVPRPHHGPAEVLVRVEAASVNGGDLAKREGKLRLASGRRFPKSIGIDFVGVVVELGDGATGLTVGDRVWGTVAEGSATGSAAEYVAVPAGRVSAAPSGLGPTEAVTLLAGGTTALTALRDTARLRHGERVLVRGGAGGVGSVAVQVAKMLGAHVTALASESSTDFVRGLGADQVIDYRTDPRELEPYDVIFDTRGSQLRQFRSRLTRKGRMVTITVDFDRPLRSLAYVAASAMHGTRRVRVLLGNPDRTLLDEVARAAEAGLLRPVVVDTLPLTDISRAHRLLEAGGVHGKLVLTGRG